MKLRDTACERCGWKFLGFHICMDLTNQPPETSRPRPVKKRRSRAGQSGATKRSDEWRENISAGMRASKIDRDREIVRLYSEEEMTMKEVAKVVRADPTTVLKVLHRASDNGDVVIRPAIRRVRG